MVHVITGLGDGGAEGVLYRLCTADQKFRHSVISLVNGGKYAPLLRDSGIAVYSLDMVRGRVNPLGIVRLWRLFRKLKPDVVQTWMYHADLIGGLTARLCGCRNVVWGIRHSEIDEGDKLTLLVARLSAILSPVVPHNIVCCAQEAKHSHVKLGYHSGKCVVIPNGYDLGRFRPSTSARERLRTEWRVGQGTVVLGMVGRFHRQKDHITFLESLRFIVSRRQDIHVVLIGTGLDNANLELVGWIHERGLGEFVTLLGPRVDIPAIMSAIDIHVLSSVSEGFPNVVAEAMACGTPCVTTDVGDAALIIGDTGWVVPPSDPMSLAEAIHEAIVAIEDMTSWKNRQSAARKQIASNFGIDVMLASYHDVWDRATRKASKRTIFF